jgi:hypothetical protein
MGGRDMVKACSKFGGRSASVRDTRLNKVVDTWTHKKKATDETKKKNKKEDMACSQGNN